MKKCAYCGAENPEDAGGCRACGLTEFVVAGPASRPATGWAKIAGLANEVEAEHLDVELQNRRIPHVMRSYHDSALDGLYQSAHGWGQVEAAREDGAAILAVLQDLRQSGSESKADAGEDANSTDHP